jgi:hypothetical protein
MAAFSNNKFDVYNWVIKVIDSCTAYFHFKSAHRLVTNFYNVYQDIDLSSSLRWHLSQREISKR